MTATYYGSDKFKASRARTAKRRYWRDPEKARQRLRDYRAQAAPAGEAMSEIDAAKVEALVAVLRTALPKLVADAFAAFKADEFAVSTIAAGLSDVEWKRLKRDENRRRAEARSHDHAAKGPSR